jgi:multidrug efflux pump subunit AcrB
VNFVNVLDKHALSIAAIALALVIAGVVAALSLPVGLFPQVSFPRVVVDLTSGDRPVDQTALTVTRPVEEAIRSVPGVLEVRSATSRGSSQISIDFGWGRDMIATTLLVDAAVTQALPKLPPGTGFDVRRMDPTVFPIIAYALTSDAVPQTALYDLTQLQIVPLLASVGGLARVGVQSSSIAEVEVLTDPHRLDTYGLSLSDLVAAISAGNALQAVGRVQDNDKLYLVVSNSNVRQLAELKQLVVKSGASGVVRLGDIAEVRNGVVPQWTRVVEDGKPAVLFNVYEQPDGNAVQIAKEVQRRLAGFKLPPGVKLAKWYDQSELVVQSAASVRDAVLIGLVLAGIVLILFLRNVRIMLIASLVVPGTLAASVLLLNVLGMSFNIMTLGGIAAAVGLVIDDVIVMVEHIARRAGAPSVKDGHEAVLPAAREFMRPLTGSSLATLIVFLPLSFLTGVTGAFSKALSVTMGVTLVISYLMASFVVPVLARRFIDFRTRGVARPASLALVDATVSQAGVAHRGGAAAADRGRYRIHEGSERLHAGGRRGGVRTRLFYPARDIAHRNRPRAVPGGGDPACRSGGGNVLAAHRYGPRRQSGRAAPRGLFRASQEQPRPLHSRCDVLRTDTN